MEKSSLPLMNVVLTIRTPNKNSYVNCGHLVELRIEEEESKVKMTRRAASRVHCSRHYSSEYYGDDFISNQSYL